MKKRRTHWTEKSTADFLFRLGADFILQVEAKLQAGPLEQKELAHKLGVTEGAVSQTLNNPGNLKLQTMINYARALGMKVSVMLYDDGDRINERGPIHADIFRVCWERCGKPSDFMSLSAQMIVAQAPKQWARLSRKQMIVERPSPWLEHHNFQTVVHAVPGHV
jgi:transcriptional regulator with XRE-family HTH domain